MSKKIDSKLDFGMELALRLLVTSQSVMVVKQNASITTLYCLSEFKDLF